jgi:hypothetical protein
MSVREHEHWIHYPQQQDVFLHLKKLKEEYFSTSNYIEAAKKMTSMF